MKLLINTKKISSLVIFLCMILTLAILSGYWNVKQDDAYIYYSYSKNLIKGNGYVFNPGEKICATTSPLYTILLFSISALFESLPFVSIPKVAHIIGAICLFITSFLSLSILKKEKFIAVHFLFPLLFLINPLLKNAVGMETFLTIMLIFLSIYFYSKNKFTAVSVVCALAVLSRPDSILIPVILVLDYIRQKKQLPSLKFFLVFVFSLFPWFLFSQLYFGRILPSSLSVKLAQTESERWGAGLLFIRGLWASSTWNSSIVKYLVLISAVLGILIAVKYRKYLDLKKHIFYLFLIWNLVYFISYGFVLNPPAYSWYYTPLAVGMSLFFALILEILIRYFSKFKTKRESLYIVCACIAIFMVGLVLPLKAKFSPVSSKYENYKLAAEWLNKNAHKGESVGANEIGVLRYYYEKGPVIDGLGLVTPGVAERVRNNDYKWFVHEYQPDYLMFNYPHRPILESMVEENWFQDEYRISAVIKTSRRSVAIYKRQQER